METETVETRVTFKKWEQGDGIVALLWDVGANPGRVMMFEHIGQHGEGNWPHPELFPCDENDQGAVARLWKELEGRGYKLREVAASPHQQEIAP